MTPDLYTRLKHIPDTTIHLYRRHYLHNQDIANRTIPWHKLTPHQVEQITVGFYEAAILDIPVVSGTFIGCLIRGLGASLRKRHLEWQQYRAERRELLAKIDALAWKDKI